MYLPKSSQGYSASGDVTPSSELRSLLEGCCSGNPVDWNHDIVKEVTHLVQGAGAGDTCAHREVSAAIDLYTCDDSATWPVHQNIDMATAHPLCDLLCVTVDSPLTWEVQMTYCRWPHVC